MYQTTHKGVRYCFYDDRLTVNDSVVRYDQMDNILHRGGESPAFVFEYGGKHVALSYPPEELQQILPYMKLASQTAPEPVVYETLDQLSSSSGPALDESEHAAPEHAASDSATPEHAASDSATPEHAAARSAAEPLAVPIPVEPSVEPVSIEPSAEPVAVEPSAEPVPVEPSVVPIDAEPVYLGSESSRSVPPPPPISPAGGAAKKGKKKKGCLILAGILLALFIALGACIAGGVGVEESTDSGADAEPPLATDVIEAEPTEKTTEPTEKTEELTTEPSSAASDSSKDLTSEERNAYNKALEYLAYTGFSRSGLIDQLKYEGYPDEACEKAVSVIEEKGEVDWNKECLEKAKEYLEYSSFSKQGLIDQLKYEGFTDEQINAIIDEAYQ